MYIVIHVYSCLGKHFVALFIILFIKPVYAFGMFGNVREWNVLVIFKLFDFVATVHFPKPENSYIYCVHRATERATHAKHAIMSEFILSVFNLNIVRRADVYAPVAFNTFFTVYFKSRTVQMRKFLFKKAYGGTVKLFKKRQVYFLALVRKQVSARQVD